MNELEKQLEIATASARAELEQIEGEALSIKQQQRSLVTRRSKVEGKLSALKQARQLAAEQGRPDEGDEGDEGDEAGATVATPPEPPQSPVLTQLVADMRTALLGTSRASAAMAQKLSAGADSFESVERLTAMLAELSAMKGGKKDSPDYQRGLEAGLDARNTLSRIVSQQAHDVAMSVVGA